MSELKEIWYEAGKYGLQYEVFITAFYLNKNGMEIREAFWIALNEWIK